MAIEIRGYSANECYQEALYAMHYNRVFYPSRAGDVLTIEDPVVLTLHNPLARVLTDPTRNCNHTFHLMEVVWMLAGRSDVEWLAEFNKRMPEFANDGRVWGAYGDRWMLGDQIRVTAAKLKWDPNTRQAVIAMWDASKDNISDKNDYPCNTHIYFRRVNSKLNMTVCNRSNDLVWGMLGANIVHMTYLHELVSIMSGIPLGVYRVFTNNLHIYERHWHLLESRHSVPPFTHECTVPILQGNESYGDLVEDCIGLIEGQDEEFRTQWIETVAFPAEIAWRRPGKRKEYLDLIADHIWKTAITDWYDRKQRSPAAPGALKDITLK